MTKALYVSLHMFVPVIFPAHPILLSLTYVLVMLQYRKVSASEKKSHLIQSASA